MTPPKTCEYCMRCAGWAINRKLIFRCLNDQHEIADAEAESCEKYEKNYRAERWEVREAERLRKEKEAETYQIALFP